MNSNPLLPRPGEIWTHKGLKVLAYVIDLQSTDCEGTFDFHFLNLRSGISGVITVTLAGFGKFWNIYI